MNSALSLLILLTALQASDPLAVTPSSEFMTAAAAGSLYSLQGEYIGVMTTEAQNWGFQVIAIGENEFQIIAYPDGLPGDGYRSGQPIRSLKANRMGDTFTAVADNMRLECNGRLLRWIGKDNKLLGSFAKIQRESPTLKQRPPRDAVVLFDGKNINRFTKANLFQEQHLLPDCTSETTFQDHRLHVEFCVPFKPLARGTARGDSGIVLQDRYEIQIIDSFGETTSESSCGAIQTFAKPTLNMSFPPLSWQTLDVDFKAARFNEAGKKTSNARITVRLNGVLVHEDVELNNNTPGHQSEGESAGPLALQAHGSSVLFRTIWVQTKN